MTIPGQGDEPFEVTGVRGATMWATGGLVSIAEDLAAFARALFEGALFDDATTLEQILATAHEPTYGLGVRVRGGVLGHDGLAPGCGTHVHYDPATGAVVVVVVNETAPGLPAETGSAIQEALDAADRGDAVGHAEPAARLGPLPS